MNNVVARFILNEAGATTVDFVVLTAAILFTAFLAIPIINAATIDEAEKIEKRLIEFDPRNED